MKKVKKIVLLLVAVLTVVGLNVFYNDEKSYEYKNNNFLAQEVTSTECDNVLPTDKSCIKKGTKTTDEWVKNGDSQEVNSCTAGETASEKVECSEKYYYKTDYTRSWVDGTETCEWKDSYASATCTSSQTKPSNPTNGTSYYTCAGNKWYNYTMQEYICEDDTYGWRATGDSGVYEGSCEQYLNPGQKKETCTDKGTKTYESSSYTCPSGYTYDRDYGACVTSSTKVTMPTCTLSGYTWNSSKKTCIKTVQQWVKNYYVWDVVKKGDCSWVNQSSGELENECGNDDLPINMRIVCDTTPFYKKKVTHTYTCNTSAGSYTEWSPKTPTKVNSCTATTGTGSTTKTECSSAKYTKTTYKKGTVEVCEQCKVTVPDTEKPVINITKQEKDGVWTITVKITDNEALASYQYGKQTTPTGEWKAVKDSPKETTFEIKNVTEAGTYYVYAKDASDNIEKASYDIPKNEDKEKPVLTVVSKEKQEDGSYTVVIKITDNKGIASYQYGTQTEATDEWTTVKDSPKETTFEIKNITEAGTYYVFAKDTSNNIGKTDYTITKEEDKEEPKVEVTSKNCENGSCIITIKLTDNVGIVGYYFSKNEEVANEWISIGGVSKEQIVEIKNVKETQETGTYYVFAKDEAGNIGKTEYTITSQDLDKETLLDLSLSLTQEDMIIKNKIKITNNSTLSFNACNVVVEVPIDSNVTLIEDSISTSSLDTSVVEIKVEKNKIIFTINKILEVNENIEITFNTKLKNSNVKKVVLEPSVTYYETKEKTCNKDTESDKVISLKKDINIEIVNNVPNTGKSTPLFIVLGVSVVAIGTGLVYNILKKSKHLVK